MKAILFKHWRKKHPYTESVKIHPYWKGYRYDMHTLFILKSRMNTLFVENVLLGEFKWHMNEHVQWPGGKM